MLPEASVARRSFTSKLPTPTSTDLEFEQYKPLIEELYMKQGRTQKEVSRLMEQHGLKATKHRYEKAFRQWKWNKNMLSSSWDSVCLALLHLKDSPGKLEVFYNGDKIEDDRVQREIRKRSATFFHNRKASAPLPDGLVILARTDRTLKLFFQLPFHVFMENMATMAVSESTERPFLNASIDLVSNLTSFHRNTFDSTLEQYITDLGSCPPVALCSNLVCAKALRSVACPILSSIQLSGKLELRLSAPAEMILRHWQILFSIANNFAGLSSLKAKEFLRFLRDEMGPPLHSLVRRASTCHTTRSLIDNLMRLSVGIGDAQTIHFMLSTGNATFSADNVVYTFEGVKCTALEKASLLSHKDVVSVLLHHKASIWSARSEKKPSISRNALEFVVNHYAKSGFLSIRLYSDIVSILAKAGGMVTCSSLKLLMRNKFRDLARSLLEKRGIIDNDRLFDEGVVHTALNVFDEKTCLALLSCLGAMQSKINHPFPYHEDHVGRRFSTLLDTAARRGHLFVIEDLLRRGAIISSLTLYDAVSGGNEELVTLLIKHGAKFRRATNYAQQKIMSLAYPNSYLSRTLSDYNEVIELSSPVILSDNTNDAGPRLTTTTNNRLDAIDFADGDDHVGLRLLTAIKRGEIEETRNLIVSGARLDVVISGCGGPPLYEALLRRSSPLVCFLLDAGAPPNYSTDRIPAIEIATCWGDRTVLEKLIDAGTRVHYGIIGSIATYQTIVALNIAALRSDKALVKLLLHADPHPSNTQWSDALQVAIRNDDEEMVQLLYESGALLSCCETGHIGEKSPHILIYGPTCDDTRPFPNKSIVAERNLMNAEFFDETGPDQLSWIERPREGSTSPAQSILDDVVTEEARDSASNDFLRDIQKIRKQVRDGINTIYGFQLDLTCSSSKICGLVLDALKVQCARCYRMTIIHNMDALIDSTKYDYREFARFFDERSGCISTAARNLPEFMELYHKFIVRAKHGDLRYLEKLLEHGCSPQGFIREPYSRDCPYWTAFLGAVATGDFNVVKVFIGYKADVNYPPYLRVKRTPLQQAAAYGHLDIVKLLVTLGADINAPAAEFSGATALQFAAIGGYNTVVDLLVNYGATVDAPAAMVNGRTALEGAAEHGRIDTVKVLLNAGAARNGQDTEQMASAIKYADGNGHPYISDMLREYLVHIQSTIVVPKSDPEPFDDIFDWNGWDKDAMSVD